MEELFGELAGDARHGRDVASAGLTQRAHAAEVREQGALPRRSDAGDQRQLTRDRALAPELAVVRVREPVRFIADALQQPQCWARAWQAERLGAIDQVDFLLAVREARER